MPDSQNIPPSMTVEQFNSLATAMTPVIRQAMRDELQSVRSDASEALTAAMRNLTALIDEAKLAGARDVAAVSVELRAVKVRVTRLEGIAMKALIGWGFLMLIGGGLFTWLSQAYFPGSVRVAPTQMNGRP
jgi:hypothetical protein